MQRDTAIPLPNKLQAMKTISFLPTLLLFVLVLPCCCVLDSRTMAQDRDKLKIASTSTTVTKPQVSYKIASTSTTADKTQVSYKTVSTSTTVTKPQVSSEIVPTSTTETKPQVSYKIASTSTTETKPQASYKIASTSTTVTKRQVSYKISSTSTTETKPQVSSEIVPTSTTVNKRQVSHMPAPTSTAGNTSLQCQQTCQIGLTQDRPANSCIDIYDCNGNNAKSGWYWIAGQSSDNSSHQFYCELEEKRCGIVGMMRVANVNTSDPYLQCPPPLAQYWAEDKRVCGPSLDERCDPVVFPVHGQSYNYVCGRALGYSFNRPWAFHYSNTRSLSQNYLTGLSITQGSLSDNHSHVWSYAAGRQEERAAGCNCPCANDPGRQPPSYVGSDYYCDTARMTSTSQQWHHNNTLWDGIDCYSGSKCCTNTRLPWFWRALNQQTTNDITVRWCASRELWIDNFGTELLEIYVF